MTENKGDLISREALSKLMRKSINERYISWTKKITVADIATLIFDEIDNAPTIEGEILTKEAYSDLCLRASKERPQGEWYENIPKGCLKARHGDYVLYKVDFLLDNLAREVNIMEGARKMRGKKQ